MSLPKKNAPEHVRRHQDVVDHDQRERQHRAGAEDVGGLGQRREPPLRMVEMKQPIDHRRVEQKAGQHEQEPVEALQQPRPFETQEERRDDRDRRHDQVVHNGEHLPRGKAGQSQHHQTLRGPRCGPTDIVATAVRHGPLTMQVPSRKTIHARTIAINRVPRATIPMDGAQYRNSVWSKGPRSMHANPENEIMSMACCHLMTKMASVPRPCRY